MSNNNYASIKNFGQGVYKASLGDNAPLQFCLTDTMDKNFYSVIGDLYGPRSDRCQAYMAERCSKNWDGYCEYSYQTNNTTHGQWPNDQYWPNTEQNNVFGPEYNQPATTGQQLLQNASARKYCTYPTATKRCEPFDPLNPDSPTITMYEFGGKGAVPVCTVDPNGLDDDPLMNRMLDNPRVVAPTLINIMNTCKREGIDLSGTRLGKFSDRYFEQMKK